MHNPVPLIDHLIQLSPVLMSKHNWKLAPAGPTKSPPVSPHALLLLPILVLE
jgi:tartrate dehydratase beta subunit/fumarate hydratase class I family protein